MRLEIVPPQFIYHVWGRVEQFLDDGLSKGAGEYDVAQLKVYLTQGEQTLGIFVDESQVIHGAVTIKFVNYPNDRIAYVTSLGGKHLVIPEVWQQFEDWMRQQGATKFRTSTYESVGRLLRKIAKAESRYIIVEKKL